MSSLPFCAKDGMYLATLSRTSSLPRSARIMIDGAVAVGLEVDGLVTLVDEQDGAGALLLGDGLVDRGVALGEGVGSDVGAGKNRPEQQTEQGECLGHDGEHPQDRRRMQRR